MTPATLTAEEILAILRAVAATMAPCGYNATAAIVLPETQCARVEEVADLAGVAVQSHQACSPGEEPYTIFSACPVAGIDVRVQSLRREAASAAVAGGAQ